MRDLTEKLSISNEVLNKAEEIAELCKNESRNFSKKFNISNYSIFGIDFEIQFDISYDTIAPYQFGSADINKRILTLYYHHFYPRQFDDTLMHELLHIYQYSKNKENHQNDRYYTIIKKILDSPDSYTSDDVMFAYALYISFDFEQDAMIHGLYGYLRNRFSSSDRIRLYMQETEEYAFLSDMENSLSTIDNDKKSFNQELFGIDVECYYHRIKKSLERYKNKIERMIKYVGQELNERYHLNEGFSYINYHWKPIPFKHKY